MVTVTPHNKNVTVTPNRVGVGEDILRTTPSGLKRGVELLGGTAEGAGGTAAWILGSVARQLGMSDESAKAIESTAQTAVSGALNPIGGLTETLRDAGGPDLTRLYAPTADTIKEDVEAAVPATKDINYTPQTTPGKIVNTAMEIAPSIIAGPGTAGQKIAMTVGSALGGEGGEAAGNKLESMTEGTDLELPESTSDWLRFGGSLAGGVGAGPAFNKLSRPFPAQPGRLDLARLLDKEHVPISAGQRTGNERLLYKESEAGGVRALEDQGEAFTGAAARSQGGFPAETNTLTRDAMRGELNRMGSEFDRLAAISDAPMTEPLLNKLTETVTRYKENPIVGGRVERIVNDLFDNSQKQGGRITGEGYSDANSKITDIIRNTEDDAERAALMEVKNALDDAVEAGLSPEDQGAWRKVRTQYRDYLPIEKAKAQISPTASQGVITPAALRTGVKGVEGARELASGARPLTALSEAGQGVMAKPPNSGTAPRLREGDMITKLAHLITSGSGAGLAAKFLGDLPADVSTLLGLGAAGTVAAIPPLRNAYIRSPLGQSLMARQGPVTGGRNDLIQMIAAARAAQLAQEGPGQRGPR